MMRKNAGFALLLGAALLGCSSEPKPPVQPAPQAEKPAEKKQEIEQDTGRRAFQRLYITARSWAPDAQPVRLESSSNAEARGLDGKAAIWRARFASASRGAIKSYQWSGLPDTESMMPGPEDGWSPGNAMTRPFDVAFLKADSDEAFKEAQANGGEKYLKQTPDAQVEYELNWDARKNELHWVVRYGGGGRRLNILVNASTGKFIRVVK